MSITANNQKRGSARISGNIVDRLNKLEDGLGSDLAREINRHLHTLSSRLDAQSGHQGTVVMKPQTRRENGKQKHSLKASGRIGDVDWALEDKDAINLAQHRSFFTCENFGGRVGGFLQFIEECGEQQAADVVSSSGIVPYFFGWSFHQPASADIITADLDTGGSITLFSTLVPCATDTLVQVNYGLGVDNTITPNIVGDPVPPSINFGIYQKDSTTPTTLNLITETGAIDIVDHGTVQKTGFFAADLLTEVELEPGEYFLAFCANSCNRIYSISVTPSLYDIMVAPITGSISSIVPTDQAHFGEATFANALADSSFVVAMPATIDMTDTANFFIEVNNIPPVAMFG